MKNDPLAEKLRAWSRRRECGAPRLQALTDAILRSLPRQLALVQPWPEVAGGSRTYFWSRLAYAALGAAAMLVIMLGFNLVRTSPAESGSTALGLSAQSALAKARVVREINSMFAGQLRWVMENNGDVRIGVEPAAGGAGAELKTAWVQTVVVSRRAGEATWRPVWSAAVQLQNAEQIELQAPGAAGERLTLWAYAVDKDKWMVDSDCSLAAPVRLASRNSVLLEAGKYHEIALLKTDDREYRVLQTVLNMKQERAS